MVHSTLSSTPPSPSFSRTSSTFSFSSFWTAASFSSTATEASIARSIDKFSSSDPKIVDCKLIWGISGKNFKPGFLFTASGSKPPNKGRVVFLPMAKSFKTNCMDEPTVILRNMLSAFKYALEIIPPSSRFSESFNESNHSRLKQLLSEAKLWEQSAQVDSKLLAKGFGLHEVTGDVLTRLSGQPNIWRILQDAASVFSCTRIGVPSPNASKKPSSPSSSTSSSSFDSSSAAASSSSSSASSSKLSVPSRSASGNRLRTISPTLGTSLSSGWLDLDKYEYHPILQRHLHSMFADPDVRDPIYTLPSHHLHKLADVMSEAQLSLNMWFAPYTRQAGVFDIAAESVAVAVMDMDTDVREKEKKTEREEIIREGESAACRWVREAEGLRKVEREFNVWNLALLRGIRNQESKVAK